MTSPVATLKMVSLDSADAGRDAAFWSAALGWEITASGDGYAMLAGPDQALGFGTVPDYEPPQWPNPRGSKQFHFDLAVEELSAAEEHLVGWARTGRKSNPARTAGA